MVMSVYVHTCAYMCIHVHTRAYVYVVMYVHGYARVQTYLCMCVCVVMSVMRKHVMWLCAYVYVCVIMYIRVL